MSSNDAYHIYKGMETTGLLREIFDRLHRLEAAVSELQGRLRIADTEHWRHDSEKLTAKKGMTIEELKAAMGVKERVIIAGPVSGNTVPTYYSGIEQPKEEPHPATKTSFVLKI